MSTFISELKRRNGLRVAALYLVAAWLIAQVTDVISALASWPPSVGRAVLIILACGFPLAVALAWIFEWTPEGIRLDSSQGEVASAALPRRKRIDYVILALLIVALAYFGATHDWKGALPVASASIAVLPFDNRSEDPGDKYFADGMHDDVLTQLAKISSLVVISRTSVLQYRDTAKTIPEIGRELGVATVLEGAVQRAGDRIRINLQLIDATTDRHIWAETFDRPLTAANVFEIQSEIAKTIANTLQAVLLPAERNRIDTIPTRSLDAYEKYLLGRREYATRDYDRFLDAERYFGEAIELDPDFALAYTGLADSLSLISEWEPARREQRLVAAEAAALEALRLDPELGEAHTSLGVARRMRGLPVEVYAADLRRGVELAPGSADARKWYAQILSQQQQFDESLVQLQKAAELDPLSPIVRVNLGGTFDKLGRAGEARTQYLKALEIDPGFMPAVLSVNESNSPDDRLVYSGRAFMSRSDNPVFLIEFVVTYLDVGDIERAAQWQAVLLAKAPDTFPAFVTQMLSGVYDGRLDIAADNARKLLPMEDATIPFPSRVLAMRDVTQGEPEAALLRYQGKYPELFGDDPPLATHYIVAPDVAMALMATGDHEGGRRLLRQIRNYLDLADDLDGVDRDLARARTEALSGDGDAAIASLQALVDHGWTYHWWYFLEWDPAFDGIRADPRFVALHEDIRAKVRELKNRIREREAAGEIMLPPGIGS